MLLGFVSDEYYAALSDVSVELKTPEGRLALYSSASGAVEGDILPGDYEVCVSRPGFGAKRVHSQLAPGKPVHWRLLADRLLGYAWPKWCQAGDPVEFRVHSVEPYQLGLWRYGHRKDPVRNIGWYDNHGPRAVMQTIPDGFFVERGAGWDSGFGVHGQRLPAPERSGLYYFHARTESGQFFSFPLVVAPRQPGARIAVLASTNTWNAYNPFGGRSNYIMAAGMIAEPIVNSKSDLARYRLPDYGEWRSQKEFEPLSFDRPEPYNSVPEHVECNDPIEGRQACHLAPAEWRLLAWLERAGFSFDLYADYQLHDGTLPLDSYSVLILSVHPEYWSAKQYERVKSWVFEHGGKLLYLGGNGINCCIEYTDGGKALRCLNYWTDEFDSRFHYAVESEANLLGVAYSDPGAMTAAPYQVVAADHWIFAGTGLKNGDQFGARTLHERYSGGASGHETDKITPSSPKNALLLARGLNPDDGGAHLVYFATPAGGVVFSAGSIIYPNALLCDPVVSTITANVLNRFLQS
jgi:hypothetical protein